MAFLKSTVATILDCVKAHSVDLTRLLILHALLIQTPTSRWRPIWAIREFRSSLNQASTKTHPFRPKKSSRPPRRRTPRQPKPCKQPWWGSSRSAPSIREGLWWRIFPAMNHLGYGSLRRSESVKTNGQTFSTFRPRIELGEPCAQKATHEKASGLTSKWKKNEKSRPSASNNRLR